MADISRSDLIKLLNDYIAQSTPTNRAASGGMAIITTFNNRSVYIPRTPYAVGRSIRKIR